MKKLFQLLLIGVLFCAPVFAHEAEKSNENKDYKNELMAFVLEKGKQYSEKAETAISKGVDIAMQEIPLVVKEFLVWRSWEHGIYGFSGLLITSLILFFIIIPRLKHFYRVIFKDEEFNFPTIFGIFVPLLFSPLFFAGIVPHILAFIKIQVAPRIYLIEELSKLLK